MIALLYKDFINLKKALLFILGFCVFFSCVAVYENKPQVIPAVFLFIPVIVMSMTFGYDMRSNTEKYIIPAPVSKTKIVLSRYCLLWITAAVSVVVSLIIYSFAKIENISIPWFIVVPIMILLPTCISIFQIPLMYAFGREMGQIIFVAFYMLVFLGISQLGTQAKKLGEIVEKISSLNVTLIAVILFGIAVVLNVLSFLVSAAIYKRKEF